MSLYVYVYYPVLRALCQRLCMYLHICQTTGKMPLYPVHYIMCCRINAHCKLVITPYVQHCCMQSFGFYHHCCIQYLMCCMVVSMTNLTKFGREIGHSKAGIQISALVYNYYYLISQVQRVAAHTKY